MGEKISSFHHKQLENATKCRSKFKFSLILVQLVNTCALIHQHVFLQLTEQIIAVPVTNLMMILIITEQLVTQLVDKTTQIPSNLQILVVQMVNVVYFK